MNSAAAFVFGSERHIVDDQFESAVRNLDADERRFVPAMADDSAGRSFVGAPQHLDTCALLPLVIAHARIMFALAR
jgi:hypothetical protein